MFKLNLNSILVVLGGLGLFATDVTVIATWLDGLGISWLSPVARVLGFIAVFFAAAPLAVPKLRAFLALFGLATPAGSVVPPPNPPSTTWGRKASPGTAPVEISRLLSSTSKNKEGGFIEPKNMGRLLLLSFVAFFAMLYLGTRIAKADDLVPALPSPTAVAPKATSEITPVTPSPVVTTQAVKDAPAIDPKYPEQAAESAKPSTYLDSKYGKCSGNFCLAPALALQVFQYIPSTGAATGGVSFNGGYGVVWHTLIDLGLAFYAGVQFSSDRPVQAQGLMMFNIANYFAFGPGFQMVGQSNAPAKFMLTICFAANWIPGIVPAQ